MSTKRFHFNIFCLIFCAALTETHSFCPYSYISTSRKVDHQSLSVRPPRDNIDWDYDDDSRSYRDNYWEDKRYRVEREADKKNGFFYDVRFDAGSNLPYEDELEWEECYDERDGSTSFVLLPPTSSSRVPTAVLHFVGGTFFGSAPKLWYKKILEDLVKNTRCAIVVTPIPVTLLQSPLQHVSLCKQLNRQLSYAWHNVLEDEYGPEISNVPLAAIGHSLGARLLVVLATLEIDKVHKHLPPYKSFILMSFTNYGAASGIPGISSLMKESRKMERDFKERSRRQKQRNRKSKYDDWYDDDDYDDDQDWEEIFEDLQEVFQDKAIKLKTALTPHAQDLEFYPTPDQLWKALGQKRYDIPETLLVQFDDDEIDQSSRLAQVLKDTCGSDVKFARLRGTHLTPIYTGVEENQRGRRKRKSNMWLQQLPSKASKIVWKALRGSGAKVSQDLAMRDLRQSIARYITDVVTK